MRFDSNILIEKSRDGDAHSFGMLVDEYSNYLFSVIFRIVNVESVSEDLVQDTFVKAWVNLKNYDATKSQFTTWLYTIASRLCFDWLKANKSMMQFNHDHDRLLTMIESPHHDLENKEIGEMISIACQNLSPQQKMIFVMRDLEQLDVVEVMQITGFTEKKINDNLYLARMNIRKILTNYLKSEV